MSFFDGLMQYTRTKNCPYFLYEKHVTGEPYKWLWRYCVIPKLWDYPEDTIFQQDGAPPYYVIPVLYYLDQTFRNCRMRRAGSNSWPDCLPDMALCDFLSWNYLKYILFHPPPTSKSNLIKDKRRIRDYWRRLIRKSVLKHEKLYIPCDERRRWALWTFIELKISDFI